MTPHSDFRKCGKIYCFLVHFQHVFFLLSFQQACWPACSPKEFIGLCFGNISPPSWCSLSLRWVPFPMPEPICCWSRMCRRTKEDKMKISLMEVTRDFLHHLANLLWPNVWETKTNGLRNRVGVRWQHL